MSNREVSADRAAARRLDVAGRLLHEIDRLIARPGPLAGVEVLQDLIDRRVAEAAQRYGGSPADYRSAFVRLANDHGLDLAEDGSNWSERWRAFQAAARQRSRWEEIRDALEDLE